MSFRSSLPASLVTLPPTPPPPPPRIMVQYWTLSLLFCCFTLLLLLIIKSISISKDRNAVTNLLFFFQMADATCRTYVNVNVWSHAQYHCHSCTNKDVARGHLIVSPTCAFGFVDTYTLDPSREIRRAVHFTRLGSRQGTPRSILISAQSSVVILVQTPRQQPVCFRLWPANTAQSLLLCASGRRCGLVWRRGMCTVACKHGQDTNQTHCGSACIST